MRAIRWPTLTAVVVGLALLGRWLVAGVVSGFLLMALGSYPYMMLVFAVAYGFPVWAVGSGLLVAVIAGLATGGVQALVAKPALRAPATAWIIASILGIATGLIAGYGLLYGVRFVPRPPPLVPKPPLLVVLDLLTQPYPGLLVLWLGLVLSLGLGLGAAQGWLLRGGPGHVVSWAVACGLGAVIASMLTPRILSGLMAADGLSMVNVNLKLGVLGALGGLVFGLITGPVLLVLLWFLRGRATEGPSLIGAEVDPEPVR